MPSVYEEVKLEDMRFDSEEGMYFYTCPCGDEFEISLEELHGGEDIAPCPSCSLKIKVLFDERDLPPLPGAGAGAGAGAQQSGASQPSSTKPQMKLKGAVPDAAAMAQSSKLAMSELDKDE